MLDVDVLELARKMRGPGGSGTVLVLDVDYSSTKYRIALGPRASRHAYYLRPPEGMVAGDLKQVLDEAGGEEELLFRYYVYPELHLDLKPLLSADPFAGKYFERDDDRRYLQIEGERPKARETIAKLLEGLKEPFKADDFPRIGEFELSSFRPSVDGRRAELVLRRKDGERDEIRKSEPGFHVAVAVHGFAKEVDIHRPAVTGAEPIIIFNSNEHTTESGHQFLADLAAYFGSQPHAEPSPLPELAPKIAPAHEAAVVAEDTGRRAPIFIPNALRTATVEAPKPDPQQLVSKVFAALKGILPSMPLLRKREVSRIGLTITIQFPGVLGFGKGPSPNEIKEVKAVFLALHGDPSLGSGWKSWYQIDSKTGEMRIAISMDAAPPNGWTAI